MKLLFGLALGALAMLSPGAPWTPADFWDVRETATPLPEATWRTGFEPRFGSLSPPASMPAKGSAGAAT